MNNELQVFNSSEFGNVRVVQVDGEPWCVGKDVAEVLGNSDTNKAVAMYVDDEDKKLNDKTSTSQQERLEVMKKNSIAREANLWLRIAQNTSNGTYKEICNAYAANTLAGREVFELPKATEKTYSATEIGKMLGVSKQKIGILSNENDMKNAEYGSWFHDKSPYSGKEGEVFRYNSKAIEKFRSLLEGGEQE